MADLMECPHCGAAIINKAQHVEWHMKVARSLAEHEVALEQVLVASGVVEGGA